MYAFLSMEWILLWSLLSLYETGSISSPSGNKLLLTLYFTVQRRVLIYFVRTVVYCFHVWWGVHSQDLCCLGRVSTVSRLREYDWNLTVLKTIIPGNSVRSCVEVAETPLEPGALRDNYITSSVSPGSVSWSVSGLGCMCSLQLRPVSNVPPWWVPW